VLGAAVIPPYLHFAHRKHVFLQLFQEMRNGLTVANAIDQPKNLTTPSTFESDPSIFPLLRSFTN
jgi:hypothetical protein